MKFIKTIFSLGIAFLTFGAIASLWLEKSKPQYINLTKANPEFYF